MLRTHKNKKTLFVTKTILLFTRMCCFIRNIIQAANSHKSVVFMYARSFNIRLYKLLYMHTYKKVKVL